MARICVFCGSASGHNPNFSRQMAELGHALVKRGVGLVYGGGNIGLMGVIADAVLSQGGDVIGVIPESLFAKEVGHPNLTALHVVKDMHSRKALMAELSDAFITAPGGFGTLEEVFEVWTWGQLGFHQKPLGFYNVDGYYDPLFGFLDHMIEQGFAKAHHRQMAVMDEDAESLVARLLG